MEKATETDADAHSHLKASGKKPPLRRAAQGKLVYAHSVMWHATAWHITIEYACMHTTSIQQN